MIAFRRFRGPGAGWMLLPVLVLLATTACASRTGEAMPRESWEAEALQEVRGIPVAELREAIGQRLEGAAPEGVPASHWRRTRALYQSYDYRPLFLERRGVERRAESLVAAIAAVESDAIDRERYPLAELERGIRAARERGADAASFADADVVMVSTYSMLADDLLTGYLDPRAVSPDWRIDAHSADLDSVLARTLRLQPLDRAILGLRPRSDNYAALQRELVRYRELVHAGGWTVVPGGSTLNPGDTSTVERLTALRDRLGVEGYAAADAPIARLAGDTARAIYDGALAGAVASFQARHAIVVDSILGPGTVESLNRPVEFRLGQIAANLERHRWLPRDLGDRFVFVNVPAFRLDAFEGGEPVLTMRVIVGAEYHNRATPAFADSMSYLEFAPYWNVPDNIANVEIWPKAQADPSYLERNNYELVSDGEGTRVRQRPGRNNALGLVKFMFPNQYNIYLHHTPQEELFDRDIRALSYGCIRVEKPEELAEYVLRGQGEWSRSSIRAAMDGPNRRVDLERKLPVYIVYFTTYVRDGELHFGNDVYGHDDALVRSIARGAQPTAEAAERLAALRNEVRGSGIRRLFSRITG